MMTLRSITSAIDLTKKLSAVAKKINNAEISNIAADIMIELADTKIELANAKTEQQALKVQLAEYQKERSKHYHDNNKQFSYDGSPIRYCTKCYDSEKKLITLFQSGEGKYYCPMCFSRKSVIYG